ncbi:hypothetical protein B0H14DRAFT_3757652 [Mycena olivaceomarginata]|nr:hypothetical protein B0H14DRAFT_3757652 [Mycena olivaceomarginata]
MIKVHDPEINHLLRPCHVTDDQDLEFDIPDPTDEAADEVVHEVLDEAEEKFRAEHLKALRGRIGAWYRGEYGGLLKRDQESFRELFTGVLDGAPPKPQRGRIVHFYSRKYYETRVKVSQGPGLSQGVGEHCLAATSLLEGIAWAEEPKTIENVGRQSKIHHQLIGRPERRKFFGLPPRSYRLTTK